MLGKICSVIKLFITAFFYEAVDVGFLDPPLAYLRGLQALRFDVSHNRPFTDVQDGGGLFCCEVIFGSLFGHINFQIMESYYCTEAASLR